MKKSCIILLSVLFCLSNLYSELKFERVWEFSNSRSTLPAWIGNTTERSMSLYDGKLYVASRNGGNKIVIINTSDGSIANTINLTGLSSGTLKGNNIGILSDGNILISNAAEKNLSIQKVNLETGAASSFLISPSSNVSDPDGGRFDGWACYGTMDEGIIIAPVSYAAGGTKGGKEILIFTITQGVITNANSPIKIDNTNGVATSAGFIDAENFYVMASSMVTKFFTKTNDTWSLSSSQFGTVNPGTAGVGAAYFEFGNKKYFASAAGTVNGLLKLFDITNGVDNAELSFSTSALGTSANAANSVPICAEVKNDGAYIYILGTNNGIACYRLSDDNVLAGTYTVGTGGIYNTLSEAISDLTTRKTEIQGDITLEIVSDITETSNLAIGIDFNPYKLTILPDKDETRTITFTSTTPNDGIAGAIVFGVNDITKATAISAAENIIISGSAHGFSTARLCIETAPTVSESSHPITIFGSSKNISFKNLIIKNGANITTTNNNYAICLRNNNENWPSNINIDGCEITNKTGSASFGISCDLNTASGTAVMSGITISNNIFHTSYRAITVGYMNGVVINRNKFYISQNSDGFLSTALSGFGNLTGNISVDANQFILMESANITAGYGLSSIVTNGASAKWNITNNFFTGFSQIGNSENSTYIGIDIQSPTYAAHNTFLLNDMENNAAVYTAVNIKSSVEASLLNNIFVSQEKNVVNSFITGNASSSNYNCFYIDDSNNKATYDGTITSLAAYQTASGQETNSFNQIINFEDALSGDLHLAKTMINKAELMLPRLSDVLFDIDGDAREENTYVGADMPLVPIITTPVTTKATNVTHEGFTANWSESPNATSYLLNIYTKSPTNYIVQDEEVNELSYNITTGLISATNYYYTVAAKDGNFISETSNETMVRTTNEAIPGGGVELPSFVISPYFNEQLLAYTYKQGIRVEINAPPVYEFDPDLPTALVFYGLPNGNSTDWTIGKQITPEEDWHYSIQHIGAQTRFIRAQNPEFNLVTIYMETPQLSWGTWRGATTGGDLIIKECTESILELFEDYNPYVVLSGHSGGGNHTFGFIDAVTDIPSYVKRISFLDSNYNWSDTQYGSKLKRWLEASNENHLSVICYNDSVALLNGEPIVSPTGGTWYRSRVMYRYLRDNLTNFNWTVDEDGDFEKYYTDNNRIQFILKTNPSKAIYHTVLVERNGYAQALLSGTAKEGSGYTFWGTHAYDSYVQSKTVYPHILRIPPRQKDAIGGSEFMDQITNMNLAEREAAIYNQIANGNIPNSFRKVNHITRTVKDVSGTDRVVEMDILPDFLAVGSDDNFCRIPMLPTTAQRLATLFNATLPTSKISDMAWESAEIKMNPQPIAWDNANITVPVFKSHNATIEEQRLTFGKNLSTAIAGHKKDIIISNNIASNQNKLYIYGWHYQNGDPIQSISGAHDNQYVDYSHGVRIVNQEIMIDGELAKVRNILRDANLYKLISNESGAMIQTEYVTGTSNIPTQVKSFAVLPEDETSVRLLLTAQTNENYTVYYGTNINSLTQSVEYNSDNPVINGLTTNELYYFAVKAYNIDGDAIISKKLAATPTNDASFALLVEGFNRGVGGNTGTFVKQHAEALKSHNKPIASASNDAVIAGLLNINDYPFVDWILGEESTADRTFDITEQSKIKSYLEAGGNLFTSGSEIGWDIGRAASANASIQFMSDYLKASYVADNPGSGSGQSHSAIILQDTGFGNDNFSFDFADGTTTAVQYPDVYAPTEGSTGFLRYVLDNNGITNVNYAGIAYSGNFGNSDQKGKIILMGIPFETIVGNEKRTELMKRILEYSEDVNSITEITSNFKVYTTPNGICINVEELSEVSIYNINGQLIIRNNIQSKTEYSLNPGMYLVKVNNQTFKIVM